MHLARNVLVDGRLNIQIGTDQEEIDTNLLTIYSATSAKNPTC